MKFNIEFGGLFKSDWRRVAGWVCVIGLGYQVVLWPLAAWVSAIAELPFPPRLDLGTLAILLLTMIGLGISKLIRSEEQR
jgi:hypothetical protein